MGGGAGLVALSVGVHTFVSGLDNRRGFLTHFFDRKHFDFCRSFCTLFAQIPSFGGLIRSTSYVCSVKLTSDATSLFPVCQAAHVFSGVQGMVALSYNRYWFEMHYERDAKIQQ